MGLILQKETPAGVGYAYHKVADIDLSSGRVCVVSYLDHAARLAGRAPVCGVDLCFEADDFSEDELEKAGATPKRIAYALVKSHAGFAGAVDSP